MSTIQMILYIKTCILRLVSLIFIALLIYCASFSIPKTQIVKRSDIHPSVLGIGASKFEASEKALKFANEKYQKEFEIVKSTCEQKATYKIHKKKLKCEAFPNCINLPSGSTYNGQTYWSCLVKMKNKE